MDDPCLLCLTNTEHRYWNCTQSCHTKQVWDAMKEAKSGGNSIRKLAKERDELRDD